MFPGVCLWANLDGTGVFGKVGITEKVVYITNT
jgi:hypothetical protein